MQFMHGILNYNLCIIDNELAYRVRAYLDNNMYSNIYGMLGIYKYMIRIFEFKSIELFSV